MPPLAASASQHPSSLCSTFRMSASVSVYFDVKVVGGCLARLRTCSEELGGLLNSRGLRCNAPRGAVLWKIPLFSPPLSVFGLIVYTRYCQVCTFEVLHGAPLSLVFRPTTLPPFLPLVSPCLYLVSSFSLSSHRFVSLVSLFSL